MIPFNPLSYRYPSRRQLVYGTRGMTATSHPLAAQAGLRILEKGGNAVDAAVATAAALTVLEPTSNGIGSDAFAIVWQDGKLYGLNSSGPAPRGADLEAVRALGHTEMPLHGGLPVNVPGAVAGWAALMERLGTISLAEALAPAVAYAKDGAPTAPTVAANWQRAFDAYTKLEDPLFAEWFRTFAPNGRPPRPGETVRLPQHAETLHAIGETGGACFYRGELAERIAAAVLAHGGALTTDDLAAFQPEWVTPIETEYAGVRVLEIPPNGHGIVALMALNILKALPDAEPGSAEDIHYQIEAIKTAFADAFAAVTEPSYMPCTTDDLLAPAFAKRRAGTLTDKAAEPKADEILRGGTVYLCTADGQGNMVSFIQSNYTGFGSGLVVPGTGIALHNRGANFKLDPNHPNALAGGKRPYHTIIPGFLMHGDRPLGPFGIMGAFMQPQAHVQVLIHMLRDGMNPQEALDAPRFQWTGGKTVLVEPDFPEAIREALSRRGHDIRVSADEGSFGRGQIILKDEEGVLCGATEKRCDGQVVAL